MSQKQRGRCWTRSADWRAFPLVAALLILAQLLAACSMWVPTTTPLPTLVAEKHPSKIRLGLKDGTHTEIKWPVIVGDSMVGSDSAAGRPVHLGEVATIKVREFSVIKTVVLAITIPFAALWLLCAIDGGCSSD